MNTRSPEILRHQDAWIRFVRLWSAVLIPQSFIPYILTKATEKLPTIDVSVKMAMQSESGTESLLLVPLVFFVLTGITHFKHLQLREEIFQTENILYRD